MASGNGHVPTDFEYWCMYLAAAIGGALAINPLELAREELRRALRDFTASKTCSAAMRAEILRLSKGETQ